MCVVATGVISGQAMVETGLGAGRAATSAAPAAGLGKAVAGALSNLDKALKSTDKSAASETIILPKDTPPTAPAKTYEPIKNAEVGLAYDDLIERFGPPALEIATGAGIRKLTYSGRDGATRIEVTEGKVSSIQLAKSQQQSSVFTLPK